MNAHNRRSIRLKGYDYAQAGAYFVTVCEHNRECLFGKIADGEMALNNAGRMIQNVWDEIPKHYPDIDIDQFQIMPNHIHGIVVIVGAGPRACPDNAQPSINRQPLPDNGKPRIDGQPRGVAPTVLSLCDVVHRFKTLTTKKYCDGVKHHWWPTFNGKLW
ncbi:MAG: transposase, partial [Candidatus Omnitrophica bacterium]|nr:transposase [Candidatus Omnitrophota bacterium]